MARLTEAEKKKKKAAARKRASRERLALGGSYEAQLSLDARIALVVGGAAEGLGCTIGQVIDELAATYKLGAVPEWITRDYAVPPVETTVRIDATTREVLGSREPYLLPCDVVEWLVLAACRLDIETGRLTYHHPDVIGFDETTPPVDGMPFEMPDGPATGALVVETTMSHVHDGLRAYSGQTGSWDGPVRDRYAEKMALRQSMRESRQRASQFRWLEEHDEADMAMALMESAREARVAEVMESARGAMARERAEHARIERMYALDRKAWTPEAAYARALDSWRQGGCVGAEPVRPAGYEPTQSYRIGPGAKDDMSWYIPASERRGPR